MAPSIDSKRTDVDLEALHNTSASTSSKTSLNLKSNKNTSGRNSFFKNGFKVDSKVVYDAILGLSDGLTVPFALTAGLASIGNTRIVILGGLAELVAGAISMALGGFIGAKSEHESYQATSRECTHLIQESPNQVQTILSDHFTQYNLPTTDVALITCNLSTSETTLHSFLMQHHYHSDKPNTSRPYTSALTLGLSYFLGGFVALVPYLCVRQGEVYTALWISIGVMGIVMLVFGYVKTCVVRGWRGRENVVAGVKGAVQMLVVGAVAVGAAVGLVKAIEHGHGWT